MIVALWGRDQLAEDTGVEDSGGWGGITLAYNARSPAEVDAVLAEVEAAGGTILRPGAETFWGGYSGAFADSRRPRLGGRPQPALDDSPRTARSASCDDPSRAVVRAPPDARRRRPTAPGTPGVGTGQELLRGFAVVGSDSSFIDSADEHAARARRRCRPTRPRRRARARRTRRSGAPPPGARRRRASSPQPSSVSYTGRAAWKSLWCAGNSSVVVPSRSS